MALRSSIRKLADEDLAGLHTRLRAAWYGDLDDQVDWLRGKGYEITRSALHRYAVKLRETDKRSGSERAEIAETRGEARLQRRALLERLGALRLEEIKLIERLRELESAAEVGPHPT